MRANHFATNRLWMIMLAALLWGTVGVTTQAIYHLTATNPLSVGFFRLALAAPVLLLLCGALLGRKALALRPRDLGVMALIGVMLAIYQACYFAAIARVGVTVATLITLCLAPVLVALAGACFTDERLTRPVALALACA